MTVTVWLTLSILHIFNFCLDIIILMVYYVMQLTEIQFLFSGFPLVVTTCAIPLVSLVFRFNNSCFLIVLVLFLLLLLLVAVINFFVLFCPIQTIHNACKSPSLSFFLIYRLSIFSLECKALCVPYLVLSSMFLRSSLVQFKKGLEYLSAETFQVFILLSSRCKVSNFFYFWKTSFWLFPWFLFGS